MPETCCLQNCVSLVRNLGCTPPLAAGLVSIATIETLQKLCPVEESSKSDNHASCRSYTTTRGRRQTMSYGADVVGVESGSDSQALTHTILRQNVRCPHP